MTQDVTRKCDFQRFLLRIRVLKTTLALNSISLIKLCPSEQFETFSVMCFLQVWSDHACEEPTRPLLRSWPFWTATVRSTLTGCSLWYRESRRYNRTCSHTHLVRHLNACCTYPHAQPHAYAWRRNIYFLLRGRFYWLWCNMLALRVVSWTNWVFI